MSTSEKKSKFVWRIENFDMLPLNVILRSPLIVTENTFNIVWHSELKLIGRSDDLYTIQCSFVSPTEGYDYDILNYSWELYLPCKMERYEIINSGKIRVEKSHLENGVLVLHCLLEIYDDISIKEVADLTELSQKIGDLYISKQFSDLTLYTSDKEFLLHKFLLRIRAPELFEVLGLSGEAIENERVKVDSISTEVLENLIQYLYSGKLNSLQEESLLEFYDVVEKYHLKELSNEVYVLKSHATLYTQILLGTRNIYWKIDVSCPLKDKFFFKYIEFDSTVFIVKICLAKHQYITIHTIIRCISQVKEDTLISFNPSLGMNEDDREVEKERKFLFSPNDRNTEHNVMNVIYSKNASEIKELCLEMNITFCKGKQNSYTEGFYLTTSEYPPLLGISLLRQSFLEQLYYEHNNGDVILRFENGYSHAYKAILATWSPVFSSTFHHDMVEKSCREVNIPDIDISTGNAMLRFMCTGEFFEGFDQSMKLYFAADKYQISSLFQKCSTYIASNLTEDSACDVLVLADQHSDGILFDAAQDCIYSNRNKILGSSEWLSIVDENPRLASKVLRHMSREVINTANSE